MQGVDPATIRLTETVQKGGCAAKLPAGQLRHVLSQLHLRRPPELKVGTETLDDACLWDLGNDLCLIQTLDFFTPIVDDARDFGAIAAANALSDIYAMGGEPALALSILAFPPQTLPLDLLTPLLEGATEKIHESGACLAGGHTIEDDTLKFGLSVSGFVKKQQAWTNAGIQAGDALILTKPLGTGTLTSALKRREGEPGWWQEAIESMKQLNQVPSLLTGEKIHAATDVTGFGLLGHALQMARASQVSLHFLASSIPFFRGAKETLKAKILNRAHRTNWEYVREETSLRSLPDWIHHLLVDPQTSGGLLLAVPEEAQTRILERLKPRFPHAAIIGSALSTRPSKILVYE